MAGGISIHAVDVASGRPAHGLRVEIWCIEPSPTRVAEGRLGSNGQLDHPIVGGSGIVAGEYEVRFHLSEFFAGEPALVSSLSRLSVSGLRRWTSIFICQ